MYFVDESEKCRILYHKLLISTADILWISRELNEVARVQPCMEDLVDILLLLLNIFVYFVEKEDQRRC